MISFSQNKEDLFVLDYFKGYKGTLLSIGENDGVTLSNAKLLIEQGWAAHLVEPGTVFKQLEGLHAGNDRVTCHNFGIGLCTPGGVRLPFYESAAHVPGGADTGLVSSLHPSETERWRQAGVQFKETTIQLYNFEEFLQISGATTFDFISIDVEGCDLEILLQINLTDVGCKCLCIEHNGDVELIDRFTAYCAQFEMKPVYRNGENIIFVR